MKIIKKIVMSAIGAVLIIVALCLTIQQTVSVGTAGGTNAKISNLSDMRLVLSSASSSSTASVDNATYTMCADEEGEEDEEDKSYSSYSMCETTNCYVSSTSSVSSSSSSSYGSVYRVLKMYRTESAVYYISEGRRIIKSSSSSYESKTSTDFKVHIYIDSERVLIYFERWSYSYSYTPKGDSDDEALTEKDSYAGKMSTVIQSYLNQWIDCSSSDLADDFIDVDDINVKGLSQIGKLLDSEINSDDEKIFSQSGDVYTLKQDEFKSWYGVSSGSYDVKGSFKVDLSEQTEPMIYNEISYDYKPTTTNSSSSSTSAYVYLNDELAFKNIGNTAIHIGNVSTVDISEIEDKAEALYDE